MIWIIFTEISVILLNQMESYFIQKDDIFKVDAPLLQSNIEKTKLLKHVR